ncbi:MAG: LptF/LptG family permease [candidate division Zixibacteria bacterium]|nr:LptF/LptG family permease [candidate division Zixibacteria bacterium]
MKILGFALLAFILVVIIVDLIENIDKFIDSQATTRLVILYYIYYIPFIIILALPVATMLSTMFTIGSLAKYHELEVMKATGLSLYRLTAPILIAGFIISIAAIFFTDLIVTPSNYKKDRIKKVQIQKRDTSRGKIRQNVIKTGKDGWVVYARTYNENTKTGDFTIIEKIEDNKIKIAIGAVNMFWADSGWILTGVTKRVFEGDKETEFIALDTLFGDFLPQTPEIMSHRMKKPRDTRFFELIKTIQLKKWMGQETSRDKVELYLKISFPFINFIIIILGIPLAANPRRSGGSVGFGISIIVSFIYFVLLRAGQSFGYNQNLPPLLAATIGNLIFLAVGTVLFIKARK